jgi:hypothetical protein
VSFPPGVQTVTVTAGAAGYRALDGTAYQGVIRLTPSVSRIVSATHGVIALGVENVTVGASGEFTTTVLATDASGFEPSGWTYRVDEEFTNAPGRAYDISLPAATPTVTLPALSPVESSIGTVTVSAVVSVNGETGAVVLDAADVGADPAGTATTAVAAHSTDTTAVHGIADTSLLETTTGAQAKVTTAISTEVQRADTAYDPAGAAAAAQAAAVSTAATDATSKVATHAGATDPHQDRAYADTKFTTQTDFSTLNGTVNSLSISVSSLDTFVSDCLNRVAAIEQGTAYLNGGHYVGPVDLSGASLTIVDGNLLLLSTGTAINGVSRGGTSNFAAYVLGTAGADQWAWQMLNNGTNDLYLSDSANGVPVIRVQANPTSPTTTITGNQIVSGGGKGYRFRTSGSSLDTESGGADWFWSTYPNADFTGTQNNYFRMESGAAVLHVTAEARFDATAFGGRVHTLDGPGNKAGFYGATPASKPAVTGSRGGNAALASLISALATLGLVTDSTTA